MVLGLFLVGILVTALSFLSAKRTRAFYSLSQDQQTEVARALPQWWGQFRKARFGSLAILGLGCLLFPKTLYWLGPFGLIALVGSSVFDGLVVTRRLRSSSLPARYLSMLRTIKFLEVLTLILLALVVFFTPVIEEFWEVDRCVDLGGVWDEIRHECATAPRGS
jgi:hypothetical protein